MRLPPVIVRDNYPTILAERKRSIAHNMFADIKIHEHNIFIIFFLLCELLKEISCRFI